MSMQMPIFQGVMNAHPLEQPVCQRSTGYCEPENRRAGDTAKTRSQRRDRLRQVMTSKDQKPAFSSGARPPRAISLGGRRGGCQNEIMLDLRAFLAFRHFDPLAERGARVPICFGGNVIVLPLTHPVALATVRPLCAENIEKA